MKKIIVFFVGLSFFGMFSLAFAKPSNVFLKKGAANAKKEKSLKKECFIQKEGYWIYPKGGGSPVWFPSQRVKKEDLQCDK